MQWHALTEGWQEMGNLCLMFAGRPLIVRVTRQGY